MRYERDGGTSLKPNIYSGPNAPFLCNFSHYSSTIVAILPQTAIIWLPTKSLSIQYKWIKSVRSTLQKLKQWNHSPRIRHAQFIQTIPMHQSLLHSPPPRLLLLPVSGARSSGRIAYPPGRKKLSLPADWLDKNRVQVTRSSDQVGILNILLFACIHHQPANLYQVLFTALLYDTILQFSDLTLNNRLIVDDRMRYLVPGTAEHVHHISPLADYFKTYTGTRIIILLVRIRMGLSAPMADRPFEFTRSSERTDTRCRYRPC